MEELKKKINQLIEELQNYESIPKFWVNGLNHILGDFNGEYEPPREMMEKYTDQYYRIKNNY